MFILKDIFKIGSSSRSNNTSHTENLQLRKYDKKNRVLDDNEFVVEESKNKKMHGWLSRDTKNKKRNFNDNSVRNTDYVTTDNKKRDSKQKQYEDFRHIKRDYFKEGPINLRNMEFEDLEGLYCNHQQSIEPVKNKFNKFDERRGKLFEDNTRKGPLKEKLYDHDNEETSETSEEDSSVDEEELTPTPENIEDETEMDSDKSFSDFSDDYSSTAVVVYPRKIFEGKNNPNKIVYKKKTPQQSYDKKYKYESSGYKRKYETYYVEDENEAYCACPRKRMKNIKITSDNIKNKQKYSDSNHRQHKQSTVRTSSTDPLRNSRGNPKIPANRKVVVIKQPSSHTRPKKYVENDYSKQKRTEYLLIPSGKRKFQRPRYTSSSKTVKRRNANYQTPSSSDISDENDTDKDKYNNHATIQSNLLKRDIRRGRSKNNFLERRMKQNQNKNLLENERQSNKEKLSCNLRSKHPQNMNDMFHKTQNHHGNLKREEQECQGLTKDNNKLSPKECNKLQTNSLKDTEQSHKKYETKIENRNEPQSSRLEKKCMKKKRHDRDSNKKCLECQQDIFIEKGIGEPYHNKKITDPNEKKIILQTIIDINKEIPFDEQVKNSTKTKNTSKDEAITKKLKELDRGEFQQKEEQSTKGPTTTTTKKRNDANLRRSNKDNLINRINRLKKHITDTTQSSTQLQNTKDAVENFNERKEKQLSPTKNKNDIPKKPDQEICKTKKSKQNGGYDTVLENMTSDFTTTEKSSMKKSKKHSASETRQMESSFYSNSIAATYVLLDTKEKSKNRPLNENKQNELSRKLSETKRDRNLQLFKLLEEMLGRRKAKRSKPKNIHTVSVVSLRVTKKERTIYKELHKDILKHYRASTSTSGVTFSKNNKPIAKNLGTKKNKTRTKKCKKLTKPNLEISILPGIEISPSAMRVMQDEIKEKGTILDNKYYQKIDDTENQNSTTENRQDNGGRTPKIFRTSRKIDSSIEKFESAEDFSLEIKRSSTTHFPHPKFQSCTDTHINNEEKPSSKSIGDVTKTKKVSGNSSLLVLNLSDSKDDIESKEWISNKLKSSKSLLENVTNLGQTVNDLKTFQRKIFSDTPPTNRNTLLYPSTIKIEVKDIFHPGNVIQSDVTEAKVAAPATPSGDTLLLTFTDSEIWGNNMKEEKSLTEKEQQEDRSDSIEMIEKLESSLQKSIVQDLKNCSRLSVKSTSSSPDSTVNTSETQRCIEEWENLVKRKVLQQLRKKVSSTYCKNDKNIPSSATLNQYSIRSESYVDNEKIQDKEIAEAEYETNQNIFTDTNGKKFDLENKNQKNKKRSNLNMSPLETVFEAEEQPTEVIEVELLKESNSLTQMRIFKSVDNGLGECDINLKELEDKISKLRNLNDLEEMEEEINNFIGDCSLNLQISIDDNETALKMNSMNKNKASNEVDSISEKLMNIYSFNATKGQAEDNAITIKNSATIQCECCSSDIISTKLLVDPKPEEEKEENETSELVNEHKSSSCVLENVEKPNENNAKTKGNRKIFSRLPVYVKKVKNFKENLFSNSHQIQKPVKPSKVIPIFSNDVEDKKDEKSTQDEGTTCNLITTKKVDNMINTEVQEKRDQTTNYETRTRNKQNKSISCDFQENTKRSHTMLPHRNKVKDVISNCLKKYRLNKESDGGEDVNKSEKQHKESICSSSSQFTTSTESLFVGENSDIDTYHSKTEKECQTTCIQNFTTDATYADKKQKHNSFPDHSQSQRSSNGSTSKTIESDLFDLSTTTYSTFNEDVLQCESEDTPNRLISVLDEKIKKLSINYDNFTTEKDDIHGIMKSQKLSDDDLSSPDQNLPKKQSRNTARNDRMPKYHCATSKTKTFFTKMKPRVTYNLTKECSAFCNLRPNLNASQKAPFRNKSQITEEMDSKYLSSFQKRKLYWESVRKTEKKCTFAINTKKSKYFLMLSGKDKKKGSSKRRGTTFFDKISKTSEPSIFFKPLSNPIDQQNQSYKEVKSKNNKNKLNRPLHSKIKTTKSPQNHPLQYEDPFIGCSGCVRVRHSSSLISLTNEMERNEQKRSSSVDSKREMFKERLPTFYSYNFWKDETNKNNKRFSSHSSDSIVDNNNSRTKMKHTDNLNVTERESLPFMGSVPVNSQSYDLDFVQNYDISELCNGNMDCTLEKQFIDKVKIRAKELFKNFMDELNADTLAIKTVEKDRACGHESRRHKAVDLESFAGDIYDDNEDMSTEKSTNGEGEIREQGNYFSTKSIGSTFTDYIIEENGKPNKEETYEIVTANTSGDTNVISFDDYEYAYTESCKESAYQINDKIDKFSHKPITLARAEIANYPNYISQFTNHRFNNDGNIINDNQSNANIEIDNKINNKQVFLSNENNNTMENSNDKNFDVESLNGDLYNSESEINFTQLLDVTSKMSSKSLNSIKLLSTIDSISYVADQNALSTTSFKNNGNTTYNIQNLTEKILKETTTTNFNSNPLIIENPSPTSNSNPLTLLKTVNQSSRLKMCASFDSFNGEAFRPSESSYFSSDSETFKQHATEANEKYSDNSTESFEESNDNCSQIKVSTSSFSQTKCPYLIVQDCVISDEDKFLQDFTETSSFGTDNFHKQDQSDSKSDLSNSSATISHYDNVLRDSELYNSETIFPERQTINMNDNIVTNTTKISKTFFTINDKDINTNFEDFQPLSSSGNQDCYPNSKSGDAIKIYESPVDPQFSSVRVYHEKIITDTKEKLFQDACSTFYSNQTNYNSTTDLNAKKQNNCSNEMALDELAMTLTSYESSPNLCSSQNQNQDVCLNTNSGTSKLTPEEMDSGFESTKQKTNAQRLLIKAVSTSDLQDLNTSVNSVQESHSSHSMFASVSSCSVINNFFHNVRRKTSRKKKDSLTALSKAMQLQRRSSIHLNQSFHWKEFWKNVRQIKDNSSKQIIQDNISKGDVEKCKEALTEEKHLFFDSLKHLKDFHFENTYLSYSLFELDPYQKRFPVGNRNFLTYNVYVYKGKELEDKATQTNEGVYFIPYVSVIAIPASSTPTTLNLSHQENFNSNTANSNLQPLQPVSLSSRYENRKLEQTSLKKAPEKNETCYLDLKEVNHGRRPYRKKKTKKTEEDVVLCDTMSVDDSGCGTFSSEKSYKIPKRLSIETFQGHEAASHMEFKDNLASIKECRSAFRHFVNIPMKATFVDQHWGESSLETNQSPRSNIEEEPLITSENECPTTSWRIRDNKSRCINEPSSSSTTLNINNVCKRKYRRRSNKNQEKKDPYHSSDDYGEEESLKSNNSENPNPCDNLLKEQNINREDIMRLQRPLLTFIKNKDNTNQQNKNKDNSKGVEPKGPNNRLPNISRINKIPQPKINIVANDDHQQMTKMLNNRQPTIILQNKVQPCNCLKKMVEVSNPQTSDEMIKIQKLYEAVGCSCSSKKVADEVNEVKVDIPEQSGHKISNANVEPSLDDFEKNLYRLAELQEAKEKTSKQTKRVSLSNISHKKEAVPQNDVQPCECMKKMMEIINPQTSDEIKKIHKLYEVVGCSCGSKKVTDETVGGYQIQNKDDLGRDIYKAKPVLYDSRNQILVDDEIGQSNLQEYSELETVYEVPKLMKRATLQETEEQTTMVVDYEETLGKKNKKKDASHCLISKTELLKQKKTEGHEVRSSLTDKEIFEKLLASYEKEDKLIRELSNADEFIELQPTVEEKQESTINIEESDQNASDLEISKSKIFEETKSKKYRKEKPLEHNKILGTDKSSTDIEQKESDSLKMEESQIFESNMHHRRTRFFASKKGEAKRSLLDKKRSSLFTYGTMEKEKESSKAKKTKVSDGIVNLSNEDTLKTAKKGDTKTITEEDIIKSKELGKCFRRGFRPDSTTLSGEPCLSLSPEEEATRLNTLQRKHSLIEFSERGSPLDYLLSLGFSIDEASNAIKDEDVKHRLYAAITEARIWVNHINANQGTLLYLAAYKTKPNTMRYFLQLIEAIINGRINDAVKLDAFIKLLERVENGEISIVRILGFDQFEDEVNEEVILRKQLRQLFVTIFKIAGNEANLKGRELDKDTIELLRILAARYRAGLHPHLELIARYIGQGLLVNEIQLEAAMIYLSRLDTADVNLSQFEKYCSITCGKNANKNN